MFPQKFAFWQELTDFPLLISVLKLQDQKRKRMVYVIGTSLL